MVLAQHSHPIPARLSLHPKLLSSSSSSHHMAVAHPQRLTGPAAEPLGPPICTEPTWVKSQARLETQHYLRSRAPTLPTTAVIILGEILDLESMQWKAESLLPPCKPEGLSRAPHPPTAPHPSPPAILKPFQPEGKHSCISIFKKALLCILLAPH